MIKIILILMVSLSSLLSHHVTDNKKVMIAYAEEWPPYSYRNENGQMKGILIDLMDTLLTKMLHVEVQHSGFPWKRAQILAENGTYDAIVTFPSSKRKELYAVNEEVLLNIEWRGFTSKNSNKTDLVMKSEDPFDLSNELDFCSVLGDGTTERLFSKAHISAHKSKNVDLAVKLLYEGRTDFFVNSKLTTLNLILKNGMGHDILMHPKVFSKAPFHFLLSNNSDINKNLIAELDKVIKKLKKEKKYQVLLDSIESEEFHKWLMEKKEEKYE